MSIKGSVAYTLLLALVTLTLGSCAKVYWKEFVVEVPEKSINADKDIQLDGFHMAFFVHAGGNSSKILTDSTFFVTIYVESSDKSQEQKLEFCNAFELTSLEVGFQDADERLSLALVKHEILAKVRHSYSFEEVVIPEAVDTLYVHVLFEHLGVS